MGLMDEIHCSEAPLYDKEGRAANAFCFEHDEKQGGGE